MEVWLHLSHAPVGLNIISRIINILFLKHNLLFMEPFLWYLDHFPKNGLWFSHDFWFKIYLAGRNVFLVLLFHHFLFERFDKFARWRHLVSLGGLRLQYLVVGILPLPKSLHRTRNKRLRFCKFNFCLRNICILNIAHEVWAAVLFYFWRMSSLFRNWRPIDLVNEDWGLLLLTPQLDARICSILSRWSFGASFALFLAWTLIRLFFATTRLQNFHIWLNFDLHIVYFCAIFNDHCYFLRAIHEHFTLCFAMLDERFWDFDSDFCWATTLWLFGNRNNLGTRKKVVLLLKLRNFRIDRQIERCLFQLHIEQQFLNLLEVTLVLLRRWSRGRTNETDPRQALRWLRGRKHFFGTKLLFKRE